MNFLSPQHLIKIQEYVEQSQNTIINQNSLDAITGKFFQGYYDDVNVFEIAGEYFESIINKHIFQNGNKRTAIIAGLIFIQMNGYKVKLNENIAYNVIMEYFHSKDITQIVNLFKEDVVKRTISNEGSHTFNYHLENVIKNNAVLIYKLSLT